MKELWLPVVGYEGLYEVSDQGRVRSLDRYEQVRSRSGNLYRQFFPGALKAQRLRPAYLAVHLSKDNKPATRYVHALVAEAFLGKRPEGMVVNHIDENKLNNKADNLEWATYMENSQHSRKRFLVAMSKRSATCKS